MSTTQGKQVFVDESGRRARFVGIAARAVALLLAIYLGLLLAAFLGASWVPSVRLPLVGDIFDVAQPGMDKSALAGPTSSMPDASKAPTAVGDDANGAEVAAATRGVTDRAAPQVARSHGQGQSDTARGQGDGTGRPAPAPSPTPAGNGNGGTNANGAAGGNAGPKTEPASQSKSDRAGPKATPKPTAPPGQEKKDQRSQPSPSPAP